MGVLSQPVDYRVFDADNHYYEPVDMFERYIDPNYRDRTFTVEERDGGKVVLFQGRPFGFVGGAGNKQRIRPGALRAMLRGETLPEQDEDDSYASDPAARVAMMDRQGIEATLMFPSTGVTIANAIGGDPELLAAHMRAFNRWLSDSWTFDYQNRIFSPAVIDLADPDAAVAELDTVMAEGGAGGPTPARTGVVVDVGHARAIPADPVYDGFWARVNEAGLLVTLHLGNSGYMEHHSTDWGEDPDPDGIRSNEGWGATSLKGPDGRGKGRSAFQWTMLYRDRPIMDTLAILIYHNLFGRFPKVQVMSVENGAIWVPYLLQAMDNMKGMARNGPWPNGYVEGKASEVFRRHVYVSPHHYGDDVAELVDLLGAERVLFGSDFPHAEGMSGIDDYQERTGEFAARVEHPADITRKVLRDNGLAVLGL